MGRLGKYELVPKIKKTPFFGYTKKIQNKYKNYTLFLELATPGEGGKKSGNGKADWVVLVVFDYDMFFVMGMSLCSVPLRGGLLKDTEYQCKAKKKKKAKKEKKVSKTQ